MKKKRFKFFQVGLASFILFTGAMGFAEVVDKVIATVNREPITTYDLNRVIANLNPEALKNVKDKTPPGQNPEIRKAALNHLIDEVLLNQEIEKQNIKISDEDVKQAIDAVLQRNHLTLETLKKELASKGSTFAGYQEEVRKQIKRIRYINQILGGRVRVNEEDVQAFYEQNIGKLQNTQEVHIAQIVIPFSSSSDTEFKAAQAKAQEIYKKAKNGIRFDSLIQQYGGEGSGDLGKVGFTGISPQVANALQALEDGQVSEPIRTSAGFIIVKMIDKPEAGLRGGEDIKSGIRDKIYDIKLQEEVQKHIDQLKEKAFIDVKS